MGLTLCGIVDEPTSPSITFSLKYDYEQYPHKSLDKSIKTVFKDVKLLRNVARLSWGSIYVV